MMYYPPITRPSVHRIRLPSPPDATLPAVPIDDRCTYLPGANPRGKRQGATRPGQARHDKTRQAEANRNLGHPSPPPPHASPRESTDISVVHSPFPSSQLPCRRIAAERGTRRRHARPPHLISHLPLHFLNTDISKALLIEQIDSKRTKDASRP
ncbi:hypothetical protein V498_10191 [Pseudogymnoascus sp. VKM F-4517 (FW-2822)]|nr:hypothetical protein V498_10191 [Pseudogymnoascus sp. VKM F-4517 (FW-2822)]